MTRSESCTVAEIEMMGKRCIASLTAWRPGIGRLEQGFHVTAARCFPAVTITPAAM